MLSKSRIKYIQSLRDKKFRDEANAFVAEGNKIVSELLQSGHFICEELIALEPWINENESLTKNFHYGNIEAVKDFELEKLSALSSGSQVVAVFSKASQKEIVVNGKIALMLEKIQDPGNLGTIIRIADWFGVDQMVCSPDTADQYNPKVVQSSMGSLGRVNVVYSELPSWIQTVGGVRIFAAVLNGKNVSSVKGLKEGIIIIGNESKGISDQLLKSAHEKISIPKAGHAESLNAAVATGIILSHCRS